MADPTIQELAKIGAGAGILAYGIVQAGKMAAASAEAKIGSTLWNLGVRAASVGVAVGAGYLLQRDSWGLICGACGGVLASSIVLVIKKAIAGWAPSGTGGTP